MQDAPLTIKLIPNADRCELERELLSSKVTESLLKQYSEQAIVARYFECVFSLEDMYLYCGVVRTEMQLFDDAIKDFQMYRECIEDTMSH